MIKSIKLIFCIAFVSFSLGSCGEGIPSSFDYGQLENNTYSNTYFDFKMDVPEGWNIQTTEEMAELTELGKDLTAGSDENFKKQLDAADIRVANLITAFQFEHQDVTSGYNPNFVINAENIGATPIKNGSEYLDASRKTLARSQMKITPTSSNEPIDLGGKEFSYFDANLDIQDVTIYQRYYSTVIHGFALNVVMNYQTEKEKELLLNVFKTIKFN